MCVYVVGEYSHEGSNHRGQKRALDPLELEIEVVASSTMWLLGTELGSSQGQYMLNMYLSSLLC